MTVSHDVVDRAWRRGWAIEPRLPMDEWADRYVTLSPMTSSEPGRWRTARFPFLREPMEELSVDSDTHRIALMSGRQLGKTSIMRILIAYTIDNAPGPMIAVQPSLPLLKKFMRLHVRPTLRETKRIEGKVRKQKSRDSANTLFSIEFDGGVLSMANAHSSAALRGGSARVILCDEINEWPPDVDGQGDPLAIVEECAANFPNRKVLLLGNPGIRGASKIETQFLAGDQRRYFLPCPACGHLDYLTWDGRTWFSGSKNDEAPTHHRIAWDHTEDGRHLPRTAHMVCGGCGARIEESAKTDMLEAGEWRATAEGDGETRSYQISSLYSPVGFRTWAECAIRFLRAKRDPDGLRSWVNNTLGETWEGETETVGAEGVLGRLERYVAEVPDGVGVLTAGVDTQADRFVYVVVGWGAGEERWIIEWAEILGDPARPETRAQLDAAILQRTFTRSNGRKMRVERVAIDSGGKKGHTDVIYQHCAARNTRGVYAVKGEKGTGKPLVSLPSIRNQYRTPLFLLCVDTGRLELVKRLALNDPGPGFVHVPDLGDSDRNEEFVGQLTAYRALYTRQGRIWNSVFPRDHVADCCIYARAALHIMGDATRRTLGQRAEEWAKAVEEKKAEAPAHPLAKRRPSSWVRGFRR